ncbi:MAG TPA: anti-sigma regulatory factor [Gemmatimonadales bacterium]|nr:anti-sigma regulatory factor [Gemmatimonadales bacterium]
MTVERSELLPVRTSNDLVRVRQLTREWSVLAGFSLVDQTKMVTAASELARNTLEHGGGGIARVELLTEGARRGVRLTCEDRGPGIPDLELALRDGYTSRGGLGLGLGGARRLVNEFGIESRPGEGTRVTISRWR